MTRIPVLGANIPTRGNARSKRVWTKLMQAQGWTILGEVPNVPKALLIGAPHTSNFDALIGVESIMAMGLDLRIMVKDSYYRPPFKGLVHWLKMIPVNRSSSNGLVAEMKEKFDQNEQYWVFSAPDGTRTKAPTWKSGFYRIAVAANIPIALAGFDYKNKAVVFLGLFEPTGDFEADLPKILAYYKDMSGAHPDVYSVPMQSVIRHD